MGSLDRSRKNLAAALAALLIALLWPVCASALMSRQTDLGRHLPSGIVNCIFQDSDGMAWIGTQDGLCRYDGYRCQVIRSSVLNPGLLSNNNIRCIAETADGRLLLGTGQGLNVYDKARGTFAVPDHPELRDTEIRDIVVDPDGTVWVGTYKRLVRCSPDFSECKTYDSSLPVTSVNSLYLDHQGRLWAMFWGRGLHLYDRQSDRFFKTPAVGPADNTFAMTQDDQGRYWLASWSDGLYMLSDKPGQGLAPTLVDLGGAPQPVHSYHIFQDSSAGNLWLVSDFSIAILDISGSAPRVVDTSTIVSLEQGDRIMELYADTDDNIWIAKANKDIYIVSLHDKSVHRLDVKGFDDPNVYNVENICLDLAGNLWVSVFTKHGTYLSCEPAGARMADFSSRLSLGGESIVALAPSSACPGQVWVLPAYTKRAYLASPGHIGEANSVALPSPNPQIDICDDGRGMAWVLSAKGLLLIPSPDCGQAVEVEISVDDKTDVECSADGTVWIASGTDGLYSFRPMQSQGKWVATDLRRANLDAQHSHISCIAIDDVRQCVWAGTNEGEVFAYSIAGGEIMPVSDDLRYNIDQMVNNILIDDIGHVWISTANRVIEYNPNTQGSIAYVAGSDLPLWSLSRRAACLSGDSLAIFGGHGGLVGIEADDKLNDVGDSVRVNVTGVLVNGEPLSGDDYWMEGNTIHLGSDARNIQIDFSTLDFSDPEHVSYAYRIPDIDRNWIYVSSDNPSAFINRLPKGKHVFEIRATDGNGRWSGTVNSWVIVKSTPFFQTWPMFIVYILVGLALALVAFWLTRARIRLRNELKIAKIESDKSEELTQTKLHYFANVSHDLLTPITIVSCLIDEAEAEAQGPIPQLDKMRISLGRLKHLIMQILDFRKIEKGKMKLRVSKGNLADVLEHLADTYFKTLMSAKKIKFAFVDSADGKAEGYFDRARIERVVFNLVSNAYKYTDSGGAVTITLSMAPTGHAALISVADTGEGITEQHLREIFDRFTTFAGSRNESNGIGLSVVKDIINLHRGKIDVDSKPGVGSTFVITLPLDRDNYADDLLIEDVIASEAPAPVEDAASEAVATMLIVEDNVELRSVMARMFARKFRVLQAGDGAQALSVVKSDRVDIVISDVMMPVMDGLEFTRELKRDVNTSHIPVILLTAKNRVEDRVECYRAGADAYIAKPFEMSVLEARIDSFLRQKLQRQLEFQSAEQVNAESLDLSDLDRQLLDKIIAYVEENIAESDLDVKTLGERFCMSKATFYRKIKNLTDLSPADFVRNLRLKHACSLLQQGKSVTDTAFACGFSSPKYFSTCFKAQFGVSPKDFK